MLDFGAWILDVGKGWIPMGIPYVPWGILMVTSSLVGGFSKNRDGSYEHIRHIPMVGGWDWNELLAMLGFRQTSIFVYSMLHMLYI